MENPVYARMMLLEDNEEWARGAVFCRQFHPHEEERIICAITADEPELIPASGFCEQFGSNLEAKVVTLSQGTMNLDFDVPRELVPLTELRHSALCKWSLDKFTEAYNHPQKSITLELVLSGVYAGFRAVTHTLLTGFREVYTIAPDMEGYRARLVKEYQKIRGDIGGSKWKVADIMLDNYMKFVKKNMPGLID